MITGLKLSNAVAGAVWQPSQPLMTAAICMFMGWEPLEPWRIFGIIVAFSGCTFMVVLSARDVDSSGVAQEVAGNIFFFFNCLGTSLYVILSKEVLLIYPSICVTAWSYLCGAICMASTTILLAQSDDAMGFLCPDCEKGNPWIVPQGALWWVGK